MARKTAVKTIALRLYDEVASDKKIVKILNQLPGNIGVQQFVKNAILEYFNNHSNKTTGEFSVSLSEGDIRSILNDSVASKESIAMLKDELATVLQKEDLLHTELNELKLALIQRGINSSPQMYPQYISQMIPAQMQVSPELTMTGVPNTNSAPAPTIMPVQSSGNSDGVGDEVQPLSNPSSDVLGFLKEMGI